MARTKTLVIDASVALKWFIEEEGTPAALEVRNIVQEEIVPLVPSLFFYEISNVLRYKPEFGVVDIKNVIKALYAFQFRVERFEGKFVERTIDVAYQHGITVYDASYVALGSIHGTKLVTADKKLYSRIEGEKVLLLGNLLAGDLKRQVG